MTNLFYLYLSYTFIHKYSIVNPAPFFCSASIRKLENLGKVLDENMPIFIAFLALLIITLVFFLILSKEEKEKTELFHIMAHKFRSPIYIIKCYMELLSDKSAGDLNDKQRKYFAEIRKAGEKMNEAVDSLIALLQLQSNSLHLKIEKVNVRDLITQTIRNLQSKIERRKLHLQEIYPREQEIIIRTDSKLLGIVFQNLIENIVVRTPENGNITIKANFYKNRLLIEIKDDQYGISKEELSGFSTGSINFKDVDFDLYLVKSILRKMRGQISFKSKENKEATFSMSLPI